MLSLLWEVWDFSMLFKGGFDNIPCEFCVFYLINKFMLRHISRKLSVI